MFTRCRCREKHVFTTVLDKCDVFHSCDHNLERSVRLRCGGVSSREMAGGARPLEMKQPELHSFRRPLFGQFGCSLLCCQAPAGMICPAPIRLMLTFGTLAPIIPNTTIFPKWNRDFWTLNFFYCSSLEFWNILFINLFFEKMKFWKILMLFSKKKLKSRWYLCWIR